MTSHEIDDRGRTTLEAPSPDLPAQRRRVRSRPVASGWRCENCDEPNVGRRRRCSDCGTSRH